ncbi:MAG TPA: PRC-barrel domain-containing protein [Gaiellales bacterium]|jgi:hypothetical protein|nr:PRC-barrel domain-containing protein [Gaiellales bacterium]
MADIWENRDEALRDVDLIGFTVRAQDGEEAGTVESTTYTTAASYLVITTGDRSVIVPAAVVERVDPFNEVVTLACTRGRLEQAPAHEPGRVLDSDLREELGPYWGEPADRPLG